MTTELTKLESAFVRTGDALQFKTPRSIKSPWAKLFCCRRTLVGRVGLYAALIATASYAFHRGLALWGHPTKVRSRAFFMQMLRTLISGEFSGRRSPNEIPMRVVPTCRPGNYERLRVERDDPAALTRFYLSCKVVEFNVDETHIHAVSYLPNAYCDVLRSAFEEFLREQIYSPTAAMTS